MVYFRLILVYFRTSVVLWSSRATRAWAGLPQCGAEDPSKPCHVYLTTAEDMATQVLVNVHTALEAPDLSVQVRFIAHIKYWDCPWPPRS